MFDAIESLELKDAPWFYIPEKEKHYVGTATFGPNIEVLIELNDKEFKETLSKNKKVIDYKIVPFIESKEEKRKIIEHLKLNHIEL